MQVLIALLLALSMVSLSPVVGKRCLCLQTYADQLANPLILASPPDGTCRIIVGEQKGILSVYSSDGNRRQRPFLDITSKTVPAGAKGLLGLAFHPKFEQNRKFYVHYSVPSSMDGVDHISRISQFRVKKKNRNVADKSSEKIIIEIPQPFDNDNGGQLLFDKNGYLLIFMGDGGSDSDVLCTAQNRTNLLGSVLRLDIDTTDSYRIPKDNPFKGSQTFREEIYAYGLHNPYRADFDEGDPRTGKGKGRIIIGEVGADSFEEINILKNGGNYGWNTKEGFGCFAEACLPCNNGIESEVLPIHVYDNSIGNAVIGGHVYRGCRNPKWNGLYIFGDFVKGRLWQLKRKRKMWIRKDVNLCKPTMCRKGLVNSFGQGEFILSFGEDYNGEIYVLTTPVPNPNDPSLSGKIYKLIDPKSRKQRNCRTNCE